MTFPAEISFHSAPATFDAIADTYDEIFTRSPIGRAQRNLVWRVVASVFQSGDRILELNCGTGEDAFFLGRRGISVVACDASPRMIDVARTRQAGESGSSNVQFRSIRTEDIRILQGGAFFDGVLSNFSGLNCVEDLGAVARDLAAITKHGAKLCLCLSTRTCLWEILWLCAHANFRKAFRRIGGWTIAKVGGQRLRIWYPTIRSIQRAFSPSFQLISLRAIGLMVPPSYVQLKTAVNERILRKLENLDWKMGGLPILRSLGDHVLLSFERVGP
jgi:ubiquinone/menaquinone biosynthesis C-methylase UbiE